MNSNPFRVFLLDDGVVTASQRWAANDFNDLAKFSDPSSPLFILGELQKRAAAIPESVQMWASKKGDFTASDLKPFLETPKFVGEGTAEKLRNIFLSQVHVAILDFCGFGKVTLSQSELEAALPKDVRDQPGFKTWVAAIETGFPGAAFFLKHFRVLRQCRAVIFLTQSDGIDNPCVEKLIEEPFCQGDGRHGNLWVAKFKMSEDDIPHVADRVVAHFLAHAKGFTSSSNWDAIESASVHDEPVVILGETGTGKEGVARSIHLRWMQEKLREGKASEFREMMVVNCAGLSAELARSELFGHVAGSFTGAVDHRIGLIMEACGLKSPKSTKKGGATVKELQQWKKDFEELLAEVDKVAKMDPKLPSFATEVRSQLLPLVGQHVAQSGTDDALGYLREVSKRALAGLAGQDQVDDFRSQLLAANPEQLSEVGSDLKFRTVEACGSLFLDEFGDLPIEVQLMLLRYLESFEIHPLAFPQKILNAKVRVIVATSDPRIASFMGEPLTDSWRSELEDERPIREDLLFRVKGPIIRVAPVRPETARAEIDTLIQEKGTPALWPLTRGGPREHLANVVKSHLESNLPDGKKPAFGHRRELSRLIHLCEIHVLTAMRRGLRSAPTTVTPALIDHLWKPSTLPLIKPGSNDLGASSRGKPKLTLQQETEVQAKADAYRKRLGEVFGNGELFPASESLLPALKKALAKVPKSARMQAYDKLDKILKELTHVDKRSGDSTIPHATYCKLFNSLEKYSSPSDHFTQKVGKQLKPILKKL